MTHTILTVGLTGPMRSGVESACEAMAARVVHADGPESADAPAASLLLCSADQWRACRAAMPHLPFVVIAEVADSQKTIEALKHGALDCLLRPELDEPALARRLAEALDALADSAAVAGASARPRRGTPGTEDGLVGQSPAMHEVYKQIGLVAPQDVNVLITGDSGTGKELVARAIHRHSRRHDRPFLAVNCAAIPETLLESELFGHERGAFTGADRRRVGTFEQADGGTLLLDEIGDMPLATQVKLLRVLQERSVQRLGGNASIRCDVRVLAATHQDLEALVASKRFRQDLYYRLKVVHLHVPPLREREVDAVLLAHYLVDALNPSFGTRVRHFSPEAVAALLAYPWPGNVRELENVIKASLVRATGTVFRVEMLPEAVRRAASSAAGVAGEAEAPRMSGPAASDGAVPADALAELARRLVADRGRHGRLMADAVAAVERAVITEAIHACGGRLGQAAKRLGISRTTLRQKMRRHRLSLSGRVTHADAPTPDADQPPTGTDRN